jgi:tripartite-type tricarboxylate transporter receptor subunit TctC
VPRGGIVGFQPQHLLVRRRGSAVLTELRARIARYQPPVRIRPIGGDVALGEGRETFPVPALLEVRHAFAVFVTDLLQIAEHDVERALRYQRGDERGLRRACHEHGDKGGDNRVARLEEHRQGFSHTRFVPPVPQYRQSRGASMRFVVQKILVACLSAIPLAAAAQQFPTKPVRVIVPFPPGNTADILGRLIAEKFVQRYGQQMIVENRPGAAGQLGLELAARAAPDGYTIAIGQGGNLVVAPHTYRKLGYQPLKDFQPVALLATNFLGLATHPTVPFKTTRDLVNYAKANPGKLSFASNGEGGFPHLAIEQLRTLAGFAYLHVPYKGTGQIIADLMGGHVDATIDGFTGMAPHYRAGRVKVLAITNPTRIAYLPDIPAISEHVPGYVSQGWFGYVAPAAVPREVVVFLNKSINDAMSFPDVREKMTLAGLDIVQQPPEFFGDVLRQDYARYGKLVKDIGFKPQ